MKIPLLLLNRSCFSAERFKLLSAPLPSLLLNRSCFSGERFKLLTQQVPKSVNWAKLGALPPVKDQGNTPFCWTFPTTACCKAVNQIFTGILISLSEQELADCAWQFKCGQGSPAKGFEYVIRHRGLASGRDYPFTGALHGRCREHKARYGLIDDYAYVPRDDERALKLAVAKHPVAVAIDASSERFWFYKKGVYRIPSVTEKINHFVTLVGYDATPAREEYFWVRNSWGKEWGIGGYMKLKMHMKLKEHHSSIADDAMYPIKYGFNSPFKHQSVPKCLRLRPCRCKTCAPRLKRKKREKRGAKRDS